MKRLPLGSSELRCTKVAPRTRLRSGAPSALGLLRLLHAHRAFVIPDCRSTQFGMSELHRGSPKDQIAQQGTLCLGLAAPPAYTQNFTERAAIVRQEVSISI